MPRVLALILLLLISLVIISCKRENQNTHPENPEIFRRMMLGKEVSIEEFDHYIKEVNPRSGQAHLYRGHLRSKSGDLNGSLVDYAHAEELGNPRAGSFFASNLALINDFEGALELGIEEDFLLESFEWTESGRLHLLQVDITHIWIHLSSYLLNNPDDVHARLLRASWSLTNPEQAAMDLGYILNREPDNLRAFFIAGLVVEGGSNEFEIALAKTTSKELVDKILQIKDCEFSLEAVENEECLFYYFNKAFREPCLNLVQTKAVVCKF